MNQKDFFDDWNAREITQHRKEVQAFDLSDAEMEQLGVGVLRVFLLMRDGAWHTADAIRLAARGTEGLRRMRELRRFGFEVEKLKPTGRRTYSYRLVKGAN